MPIVRITTNVTDSTIRQRVASSVAEVFGSLGVPRTHITTIFLPLPAADLYVADTPLALEISFGVGFALVEIGMSSERGHDVRAALARAILVGFGDTVERKRVAIDFIARERQDSYIGTIPLARRRRADRTPGTALRADRS